MKKTLIVLFLLLGLRADGQTSTYSNLAGTGGLLTYQGRTWIGDTLLNAPDYRAKRIEPVDPADWKRMTELDDAASATKRAAEKFRRELLAKHNMLHTSTVVAGPGAGTVIEHDGYFTDDGKYLVMW